MSEPENFKEKARRLIFNSELRDLPILMHMYVETLNIYIEDLDSVMGEMIKIIRTSHDASTAFVLVSHYLDDLEGSP